MTTTRRDVLAALARGAAGGVPIFGGLIAEAIDAIIPGQKLDRVVAFVHLLSEQAQAMEAKQEVFEQRLRTAEGSDLLEESIVQASRALTSDRRRRIAHIVVSGITQEVMEYDRTKKLLSILGDLNDSELMLLIYFSETVTIGSPRHSALRDQHPELLRPVSRELGASKQEAERGAFRDSYERTLVAHGLLERTQQGLQITPLGRILVESAGR